MLFDNWGATARAHAPEDKHQIDPLLLTVGPLEQRQARKDLNSELAAILELSPDAIMTCAVDGAIMGWNAAAERIYGYSPQQIADQHISVLFSSDQTAAADEFLSTLRSGERVLGLETIHIRKNGVRMPVLINAAAVKDNRDSTVAYSLLVRDIADQNAIKEQLRQSQKMEAIGMLAGGIAHDFNNLLTVILGRAELMVNNANTCAESRGNAALILRTAQRAARLTRQLLQYSRQQGPQTKVIDIHALLAEMDEMLSRLLSKDIDLELVLSSKTPTIRADRSQIQQVVLNLVVNAHAAMLHGGKITISTQDVVATDVTSGDSRPHVLLSINDTGCGMDDAVRSRVFEPFFTTKAKGSGTGLGLFTVSEIVKQSGGSIIVDSKTGYGTTFKVYFPLAASAPSALTNCNLKAVPRGRETILLVEDEDAIRSLLYQFITAYGYFVLLANDGEHAVRIANDYSGKIDLMLADVVMPKLGGKQAAAKIAARYPQMKVVYMTAYGVDSIISRGLIDDTDVILQKPFLPEVVLQLIREVLDTPSRHADTESTASRG